LRNNKKRKTPHVLIFAEILFFVYAFKTCSFNSQCIFYLSIPSCDILHLFVSLGLSHLLHLVIHFSVHSHISHCHFHHTATDVPLPASFETTIFPVCILWPSLVNFRSVLRILTALFTNEGRLSYSKSQLSSYILFLPFIYSACQIKFDFIISFYLQSGEILQMKMLDS
jgi:hypothetical protein